MNMPAGPNQTQIYIHVCSSYRHSIPTKIPLTSLGIWYGTFCPCKWFVPAWQNFESEGHWCMTVYFLQWAPLTIWRGFVAKTNAKCNEEILQAQCGASFLCSISWNCITFYFLSSVTTSVNLNADYFSNTWFYEYIESC